MQLQLCDFDFDSDGLSVSKDISSWDELINGWKMWIESEVLNNDLKNEQKKQACFVLIFKTIF